MLRARRDDVPASIGRLPQSGRKSPDCRLRSRPKSKSHPRHRRRRRRDLGSRGFDERARRLAIIVARRAHIPELAGAAQDLRHLFGDSRIDRCRRRAIQISGRPHWPVRGPAAPRARCTALNMPRRMFNSLRSSCARLNRRRRRSIRWPVRSSKSISRMTCAKMRVEMLHRSRLGERRIQLDARSRRRARDEELVGDQLHRHRQVQRAVFRVRRNAQQRIAVLQILGREAVALRSEQQRDAGLPPAAPRSLRHRRAASRTPRYRIAALRSSRRRRRNRRWPRRRSRPRARMTSRSSAPAASALASACGKDLGRTSAKSERSMFFIARATEPILPGWLGSIRTMRTRSVMLCYSSPSLCIHYSISACAPPGAPAT